MSNIDNILKSISKKYEGIEIKKGVDALSTRDKFSLGSPGFDFCTYNAIPEGIFVELSGAEGSGKTTGAFLMASSFIRKEKAKPVEERRHILFVDVEGTADCEWALTSTGYDMNDKEINTFLLQPTGQSAEQIFDIVLETTKSGEIGLVIFDSLTAIAPQQVVDESLTKKDMGTVAKVMADFVRRATGIFNKYKTTFIGINGEIQNIGGYGNPTTTPGGTYWRRACSLRLKFKKGKFFDEEGNELTNSCENPAGHIIEMVVLKSKFCRGDRKLGRVHLNYVRGIDILQDTIDIAIRLNLINNYSQGWFNFTDIDTGEVICDEDGNEIKIRGQKNLKPYLLEHKDLWKKIYDKVYEIISKKDDPNIKSFEQMLGINIEEHFNIDLTKEEE